MDINYMNQTCKVCGEPAAGFHFGAFTCEGCKSFFGRSYNNISSINDCKNNNKCVINKKNRTACKACRLRKCMMVGMSKSGSRYGRRSNWFKIHCLLQEQQSRQMQESGEERRQSTPEMMPQFTPPPPSHHQPPMSMRLLGPNPFQPPLLHLPRTREELMLLGLDEQFRHHSTSPSVSSPESHNSDSSIEVADARRLPLIPGLLPHTFLPHSNLLFPPGYPPFYPQGLLQPAALNNNSLNNNNNKIERNNNPGVETKVKREYLDAILQLQRPATPPEAIKLKTEITEVPQSSPSPIQDAPIDLSMKTMSERSSSPSRSEKSSVLTEQDRNSDIETDSDCESENLSGLSLLRHNPLDLTTKV